MATGKLGRNISIDELEDGSFRVLGEACRYAKDGERDVETDTMQTELFFAAAQLGPMTVKEIRDALKAEVGRLAELIKATESQKRFVGLTIE